MRAVVVLRDGYAPSAALARELQEHVKRETAPYKYPRIVEFARRAAEDRERQGQAGAAEAGEIEPMSFGRRMRRPRGRACAAP